MLVDFTPTVFSEDRIHLEIAPEISEPDFNLGTTVDGTTVGTVEDVLVLPANLVLRVQGEREVLVPVIPPVVEELDRDGGRLTIRPMPGLLDDDAEVV